ncbi:Imm19 family immunity protein [Rapidithrix thailandica]|uniref:Imm19 family immunity protein n=1 Tax=Rapidithrix thailandica TaxID=413964 RepID=A0AAW9SAM9_9BACT
MNNQLLTKKDIEFDNLNFWHFYISYCFRGFDEQKELNIDEAIREVVDIEKHIPFFKDWYDEFCSDEVGTVENPKVIAGKLTEDISFAIEFHSSETTFFLNSKYIGNQGGHFEAWFLTLKELISFDKYEKLFLLLLPMTGVEENKRELAESLVSKKLKSISMFAKQSDYIANMYCEWLNGR